MIQSYDFDMFSVIPKELQAQFGDMFAEAGLGNAMGEQRALFRDAGAVAALQGASEEIKDCFLTSGFGLNVYDSGAGPGRFPPSDGPARAHVIEQLLNNLERLPSSLNWNGFDIEAFAMAAMNAKPLDTAGAKSFTEMRHEGQPTPRPAAPNPAEQAMGMAPEAPGSSGGSLDSFFSGAPNAATPPPQNAGSMDAFFSGNTGGAAAAAPEADPAPNLDDFFSDTSGSAAHGAPKTPQMTADDIRMTLDTPPPQAKKMGFGPIKMGLMAIGLYIVVSMLGGSEGGQSFIEKFAGGGNMVSVNG